MSNSHDAMASSSVPGFQTELQGKKIILQTYRNRWTHDQGQWAA